MIDHDETSTQSASTDTLALARMTRVLRAVGALLLVASASVFMLQHWGRGNDLSRYLMLLGQSAVLALAGVVCGARIREARSARTFMALVAALVPVNFTVLGALLYSRFSWDGPSVRLPAYAIWHAPNDLSAAVLALFALATLAGLSWLALRVLARTSAGSLSVAYLGLNALLLIPVRNPSWVGLALIAGAVVGLRLIASPALQHSGLRTGEGRFARALLFVPLLLLMARACCFYQPTLVFLGTLLLGASYALFAHAKRLTRDPIYQKLIEALATLPAALGCALLGSALSAALAWPAASTTPCIVLPYLAILVYMSKTGVGSGHGYLTAASVIGCAAFALNLAEYPSLTTGFCCLAIGVAALAFAAYAERVLAFAIGLCAIAYGAGHQLSTAIHLDALFGWGSLSLLGITLIVLAAVFERHTHYVVGRALQLGRSIRAWQL